VTITDEALVEAARLADRYISDRFLPDKAIDLLDEASSKLRIESTMLPPELREMELRLGELTREGAAAVQAQDYEKAAQLKEQTDKIQQTFVEAKNAWLADKGIADATVDADDIAAIVSSWTGIPVQRMLAAEADKLLGMEEGLHRRVIGQDRAVVAVAEAVRRARAGLKDPSRPIGSFIFLGPTGVGKTELARALAEFLFDDEGALIRLDMSEYMEKFSASRLVGSPPGYVGFDEGGQLTEAVRRRPYAVVLFDEIEKAHPDVFNMLLQILDDGRLTDGKGRTVDFKNAVVIMTSNVGSGMIRQQALGFSPDSSKAASHEDFEKRLLDELRKTFRPEFLNRVDEVIVFDPLDREQLEQIVDLLLERTRRLVEGQGMRLEVTAAAKARIVDEGYDAQYGARPLRRAIRRLLENPLSSELLRGDVHSGDTITVDAGADGALVFAAA
jgi:ATP-dependent Clp protease ATP-binding subunit ClpC